MFNISKLTREHSLTSVAFHQILGVHMLSHAKWGTKSKHDMQIHKKPRIGLEPSSTATNLSVLIIRSHTNHLANHCKESNNQNTKYYKKKVKLDRGVILTWRGWSGVCKMKNFDENKVAWGSYGGKGRGFHEEGRKGSVIFRWGWNLISSPLLIFTPDVHLHRRVKPLFFLINYFFAWTF